MQNGKIMIMNEGLENFGDKRGAVAFARRYEVLEGPFASQERWSYDLAEGIVRRLWGWDVQSAAEAE
jgi:hypothetical protein